jgi:hypothetical protein
MIAVAIRMSCCGCGQTVHVPAEDACQLFLENGKRDPDRMVTCAECQTWFEVMVVCTTPTTVCEPVPLVAIEK